MQKIKLNIVGPFDRFNYGDLLFPLMISKGLDKLSPGKYIYKYYSMIGGDYTEKGSIKSENYKEFKNVLNRNKNSQNIIIAGGESIGATWTKLYSFINPSIQMIFKNTLLYKISNRLELLKYVTQGYEKYPFVIDKTKYTANLTVAYNSVGGAWSIKCCTNELSAADYLAVRENLTSGLLDQSKIKHCVYPDCAILLSEIYPKNSLQNHIKIRQQLKSNSKQKYIFFQIARNKTNDQLQEVIQQLNQIGKEFDLKLILCPIGTAPGHEDHIPLQEVSKALNVTHQLILEPSIFEIMWLIANSEIYIGTSLHGIITAMSYSVPYIGLNPKQKKIEGYLKTWGHSQMARPLAVQNFYNSTRDLMHIDRSELKNIAKKQKELYWNSLKRIDKIFNV